MKSKLRQNTVTNGLWNVTLIFIALINASRNLFLGWLRDCLGGTMHFGKRYSSLTRIALLNIRENKQICTYNYSSTIVYFERFYVVLGHFSKASCAKYLLVTKAGFLRKWASTLALGTFSISETERIKDKTLSTRYIIVGFGREFNRKKVIIYFFLGQNADNKKHIKGNSRLH